MRSRARPRRPARPALPAVFRALDLERWGIPRSRLRAMLDEGEVEQAARGLYRFTRIPPVEYETVALVARMAPNAVVCLLTALRLHGLGTQAPRAVWIAIDRKARRPRMAGLPVRIVRFSGRMMRYGVQTREIQGVEVPLTSPARTVVDCFRYRRKIGLDVALEALRDAVRTRATSIDEILRVAEICRAITVVRPYVESLAS